MVRLAINGICGRMGQRIFRLAKQDSEMEVMIGLEQQNHPQLEKEIEGVRITADNSCINQSDCIIDFTVAEATIKILEKAKELNKAIVIGTTNLDKDQKKIIKEASEEIPIVYSPNMSIGVNLFFKVLKEAASILRGYKPNIKEAHHIHKKDSPSGTAKKLAEIINEFGFNIKDKDIGAKRKGEIIGDHQVSFESNFDSFTISHHAKTRDIFAQGALTASKWLKEKKAGLYSMEDVLFGPKS